MGPRRHVAALVLVSLASALTFPATAPGTFAGENGKILISVTVDSSGDIKAVDPSTGASTTLTSGSRSPAASPDGTKIAFSRGGAVWVMNADGSGQTQLNTGWALNSEPTWSPDGTQIAFVSNLSETGNKVYVMDADGQNAQQITFSDVVRVDSNPEWSPDGSFILFSKGNEGVWKVRPDGSDLTPVRINSHGAEWSPDGQKILLQQTNGNLYLTDKNGNNAVLIGPAGEGAAGVLSPDGSRIAFGSGPGCCFLWTMNADGTDRSQLAPLQYSDVDWQPIPINAYPRPKGATPMRVSLVPAFQQCASGNRVHGPPLEHASCNPPAQSSSNLTVGTPDANGHAPNSSGVVRYGVLVGDPDTPADEADVMIDVSVTDVRLSSDSSDYTGELRALAGLRITDKDNVPAFARAATVADTVLGATVPCAATADPASGAACTLSTTADALIPDTVKEQQRAIWRLAQVAVSDGGADGDADTPADNTPFLTQGIFVP